MLHEFIPKSYLYLRQGYSLSLFKRDLIAGITVGIVALPLAMAFGIASGVSPDRGIFTAIIAGFLISALGGSRVQIGGPTGAFVVIIYDIITKVGYDGLVLSTLIAALFLIFLGVFRMGSWIKYVPYPLIIGFTSGIAVIIFSSQMKEFFGLKMDDLPAEFVDQWGAYIQAFPTFHLPTFLLGMGSLIGMLFIRRFFPKIPWGIVTILIASCLSYYLELPVATIQSKFGQLPHMLPAPALPSFHIPHGKLVEIFMGAITIAFLGAIESLLSAVIADGMLGTRHKSNCELVGQGIANFASAIFGGIPATGALARTATNVKTGAATPLAGMIHAVTLFCLIFFFAPAVSQIPLTILSAVLIIIAWNMSEASHFIHLLKAPLGDRVLLIITFLLTVFVDITVAISFGMVLASLLFMKSMSQFSKTVPLKPLFQDPTSEFTERSDPFSKQKIPKGIEVYEIQGPFFFGAADMLQDLLFASPPQVFILRMRHVPMIDASGMHALREFHKKCKRWDCKLFLSEMQTQTKKDLEAFGITHEIGESHLFPHIEEAFAKAEKLLRH